MTRSETLRLTGAELLTEGQLARADLWVAGAVVAEPSNDAVAQVDLSGYLVLPGIIDLHGDAFERHLAPRPSAPFPAQIGLESVDRDAASSGVTTAWMAQSWSWEGGSRSPAFAVQFMADLAAYRPRALTDLRIQLRCETFTVDTADQLIAAVRTYGIDYVIFNDHLGEALDMIKTDPENLSVWGKRGGRDLAGFIRLLHDTKALAPQVPRYLCILAAAFDELGVTYGSHDDHDAATRDYYGLIGAKVCEFPTRHAPASVAKAKGDPVLMGAPNVVRGGSQAGNVNASDLIRAGLCDALVSDYHYPSLAHAAFTLSDQGILPFAKAWEMISTTPARIMKFSDRGVIAKGKRADLVICNAQTRAIEGTMVAGRWSHLCGDLADRVSRPAVRLAHAAE
ncbi:MAG: alpha-D-ribose 1-methylphosphonate 5-triphosphate diphosphatase [Loktanella sp.]|nr:alpha-D-ribose 1-methylphosphonate 5-triphosphate diphosphatase [Loktanella sp.]